MKEMIKRYIGLGGFLIASILIIASAYYEYYDGNDYEQYHPLFLVGIILWATTSTITYELNKQKPKNWFIYLVIAVFFIAIFLALFN
jgi:CDP-diglyceride synthetase